ncbi:NAD(P)-binding domain-containing protein [Allosphingosinicella flava]|uniref:Shikimate dehydrogenase (NADP(+)) n=1 Tax=Allosphingosinicella flava TaxID=2771430 RepID=A0A7T2GIV4_9SPHN|nr:NAD(P)-binding domain-containing protein [Sphingosinicella flava]QPQ54542.1 NAD(P)-binding domain-containing protein [Sphingosinicella flava]
MSVPYAEVIGDPVAHSLSPIIHAFWLARLGLPGAYRALRLVADDLPAYFAARAKDPAWRGCNVTMPLKEAILPYLTSQSEGVRLTGACNTVSSAGTAYNSDIAGVRDTLTGHGIGKDGAVRIIGTGGAARAAIAGCLAAGISAHRITVHGRSADKASALAAALLGDSGRIGALDDDDLAGADILINASPLGMAGFPPLAVEPQGLVFDMVYHPRETALLASARARGLPTVDGIDMLIAQAAAAFPIFFGHPAPRDADAALRQRLTS